LNLNHVAFVLALSLLVLLWPLRQGAGIHKWANGLGDVDFLLEKTKQVMIKQTNIQNPSGGYQQPATSGDGCFFLQVGK
jgi:hypothetical protein